MRNLVLIATILFVVCATVERSTAQTFVVPVPVVRTLPNVIPIDYRLWTRYNFKIPVSATDTTLYGGVDSLGLMMQVKSGALIGIWYRDTVLTGGHKWSQLYSPANLTNYWQLSSTNLTPISTTYNVGIGTASPAYKLDVVSGSGRFYFDGSRIGVNDVSNNILIGVLTGLSSTASIDNVAIGNNALRFAPGDRNVAIGLFSLASSNGDNNTAIGSSALASTDSSYNSGIGYNAGILNFGASNTAIGALSGNSVFVATGTINNSEITVSSTAVTGATTTTYISTNSLSIGQTYPFHIHFNGGIPSPYGTTSDIYIQGAITNSSTITFTTATFTSQGSGNFTLELYNRQSNSTAIGYNATTDSSNQIVIGNSSNTIFKIGSNNLVFDLTTTPSASQVLSWDGTKYVPASLGGGGGGVSSVTGTSPINVVDGLADAIVSIDDASTSAKGAASFNSSDFIVTAGNAAINYASGQAASNTLKGFLSSGDWITFNNKQAAITGGASSITTSNLTINRALISDASGKVAVSATTNVELAYMSGVTSAVQTQLNAKLSTSLTSGQIYVGNGSNIATAVAMSGDATIDNTGAVTLANTAVVAGTYASANITVDAAGRITAAADGSGGGGAGSVTTVLGASPIISDGDLVTPTISIVNAAADGSTKGAAWFNASDFNDNGSGGISNDYINGQSASAANKGYLTSADWSTFNNKASSTISIIAGTGLTGGGDLSANRTLSLTNTGVSAGTYANPSSVIVDAQGRIVGISAGGGTAVTSVFGRTGVVVATNGDYTTTIVPEGTNLYYTNARADARITLQKGVAGGLATLDGSGKVPTSQLPAGAQVYKGTWNVITNTPTLIDGVGTAGDTYRVTVGGTRNLGSGNITWSVGDDAIYNGTIWQRNPAGTGGVASVNGFTGTVVLTTTDIAEGSNLYFSGKTTTDLPEGTNLYFTNARARTAISASTGISYNSSTGAISLAATSVTAGTYSYPTLTVNASGQITTISTNTPVTSFNGRTGAVVPIAGDYTTTIVAEGTNLYYTNARADARITAQKGVAGGIASLDGSGKVPVAQLPAGAQVYKGTWNALTNTPTLADGVGTAGDTYRVTAAGTQNLGSGNITFSVGDDVIYNGTIWQRNPAAVSVTSVNGLTGTVVLTTDNIAQGSTNLYFSGKTTTNLPEGTNLYFTNARARAAFSAGAGITLTTGVIALANTTVVAGSYTATNITVDAQGRITAAANGSGGGGGVSSVGLAVPTGFTVTNSPVTSTGTLTISTTLNGILRGTGANTVTTTTIGSPLTFTGGTLSIQQATSVNPGFLTSADWVTFNAKQAAITGAATTITTANLTASRALISNAAGKVAVSVTTLAELAFLSGTTSSVQTQLNAKEASIIYAFQTIADASPNITLNGNLGINFRVTLGGSRGLVLQNITQGKVYKIEVNQDATGNRLLTLPANSLVAAAYGSGTSIVLSTGALDKDVLSFIYDGTNYLWTKAADFQ